MNYSMINEDRGLTGWNAESEALGEPINVAGHALAILNSFVLTLFNFLSVPNAKQQMRFLDAHPLRAVHPLLTSLGKIKKP